MKASEIETGHTYVAKVSGKLTRVRVDSVREDWNYLGNKATTQYDVTNLATGRRTTFRSARRFRSEAKQEPPLTPAEIKEDYRALLSKANGDADLARKGLEAYLAGRSGLMPRRE